MLKSRFIVISRYSVGVDTIDNEVALIKALKDNRIGGAARDVLEKEPPENGNPLRHLENVRITPHGAWYSADSRVQLKKGHSKNATAALQGKIPTQAVNFKVLQKATTGLLRR